jgi:hypothetical protein
MVKPPNAKLTITGTPQWFTAVFVALCVVAGFGFIVASLAAGGDMWMPLIGAGACIAGFLLLSTAMPTVQMDDTYLYVSKRGKSAVVPLEHVAGVRETPRPLYSATIDFSVDTPFGRSLYLGLTGGIPGMTSPRGVKILRQAVDARSRERAI